MQNKAGAIAQFFEDLAAGDPFAWGFVGLFAFVGAAIGLFALKIHFAHKKEDAARVKKYGRGRD